MKYDKYVDRGDSGTGVDDVYRVAFRRVFIHMSDLCEFLPNINTGAAARNINNWKPKRFIHNNYKRIFHVYKTWRGVDE